MTEMWSFVQSKQQQRWLWHAIDKGSGVVLAYVLPHHDEAFVKLKALLEAFGVTHFYSDGWGADSRHLDADVHTIGKRNTQKIERKHLTLRTRIKRLARKTICFSRIIYARCCHRAVYQSLRIWLNYLELNQTTTLEHYPRTP
ncbi:MAG TPA: IS1 family transposase [Leptolyngbyaceae cyanobacterium]